MDTGLGNLAPISVPRADELEAHGIHGVFRAGELVTVKGSTFVVDGIYEDGLRLKLVKSTGIKKELK